RGTIADSDPAFSPDGRRLAFARNTGFKASELYVVPLSPSLEPAGIPQRLFTDSPAKNPDSPAWTTDGREIVFSASRISGDKLLWRIKAGGGQPQALDSLGQEADDPAFSPKGSRLVFTRAFLDVNIWRIALPDRSSNATLRKSPL